MMTEKSGLPAAGADLSPEAIRAQLRRMLSSEIFVRSERMTRFLQFTVEQYLAGNAGNLKEYLIGVEVFDKPETLDPRLDPIVRVEAGRLRAKLREYYETVGREDPVLIHFPARSYVPAFERRLPGPAAISRVMPRASVAVLPFADLSRDRDQEFFCDGLTDEVIVSLAQLPVLQVVSRTSSFQYKGKAGDVRHIGEELNVRAILEGSVRCYGGRLRVTVQLVDAADGYYLWSQSFDGAADGDIFGIQREISAAVARRMGESLALNRAA